MGGDYTGFVDVGFSNYSQFEAAGAVSLPISSTFAARVAFSHTSRDSFYKVYMDPAKTIKNPGDVGAQSDCGNGRTP